MTREIIIPARTLIEEIRCIEEYPQTSSLAGRVNVVTGAVDETGVWVESSFQSYQIDGTRYAELTAIEPPEWAPDKPAGTYRNEDLWHFIDLLRNA